MSLKLHKSHATKTYLRCKCCENEISHCDICEAEFENEADIYCSADEHICEDCAEHKNQ